MFNYYREKPPIVREYNMRDEAYNLNDGKFRQIFRLNKSSTQDLIDIVEPYMKGPARISALDIDTKVLNKIIS